MNLWQKLVEKYKSAVIEFPNLKPVTLAQWSLESGRGKSELAKKHFNFGGMKYRREMATIAAPVEYEAHDGTETYCKFKSIEDFIKGYWIFIDRFPYAGWRESASSGRDFIGYIGPTYCPTPGYVDKVLRLLPEAERLLDVADEDEPDRPSRSDTRITIDPPIIRYHDRIQHVVRGSRPNGLEGMIVHFDAFRIRADNRSTVDDRAVQMLTEGERNRYCYATISRTGQIQMPGNVSWLDWGYHAGASLCPVTGRRGVSKYYIGVEINNPGTVFEDEVENVFFAWFNTKLDSRGRPRLRRGRRQIRSMADEHYQPSEVRFCEQRDNIKAGWYVPYTKAQFDALISLIRHLSGLFPDTFSIDKVLGHDEVAPDRKNDPGGALAFEDRLMSGPEFRRYLKQLI